jgi:hypothetical protein
MDESPRQLIEETRIPIEMKPGKPPCYDTEYTHNGTCEIFMFSAPRKGWRRAEVPEQRMRIDWAQRIKNLLPVDFPNDEKIILVRDNLNTHTIGSLYKAFPPAEGKSYCERREIH